MIRRLWALLAMLACVPVALHAHEVPDRVRIDVFIKAEADRFVILVRMPANALIDYLFPTLEEGNWLDLPNAQGMAEEGARVWIADLLTLREDGRDLPRPSLSRLRISRLNDESFGTFDQAMARIGRPPLPAETLVLQDQVTVDALLELPVASPRSAFEFTPRFGRLGLTVDTSLTYLTASGDVRVFQFEGDPPPFELDATRPAAFARFLRAALAQFTANTDAWLVLVCVALAFPSLRVLSAFGLAFLAAQALTIVAATPWIPGIPGSRGLIGVLVASAGVYMGTEVLVGARRQAGAAIGCGAIVGASWTLTLQPVLQFAGAHAGAALAAFTVGVAASQALALLLLSGLLMVARRVARAPNALTMIAAGLVIHIAWRRVLDRADALLLVPVEARTDTLRLLTAAVVIAAMAFLAAAVLSAVRRRSGSSTAAA